MPEAKLERNEQMLLERIGGSTLEQIGERHGISHERAHTVTVREATRHLDQLELQLMTCAKTGEVFGLAVANRPDQSARTVALDYLAWAVRELRGRGIEIEVETQTTPEGLLIMLTDVRTHRLARAAEEENR